MREVVLGADLGTSGLKVAALALDGATVAEAEVDCPVLRPRPREAEADVGGWVRALHECLAELAPALADCAVRGLGLSGQMHGLVLLDGDGGPLGPALLWQDGRADAELARWRDLPPADRAALANPLEPGRTGPLLAWTAAHEPDRLARAAAVLLPKDALRAALLPGTDPRVTDRSDAAGTLLWDVPGERWSPAAVAVTGADPGLLPAVRPSDDVAGTAPLLGADVPVVVGGADTPLALLAAGADGPQLNLGTGAQLLLPGGPPEPADDPPVQHGAQVLGGWYAMAALRTGASAWEWARGVLGLDWPAFEAAAASVEPGARGVVFTPSLTGEPLLGSRPAGWTGVTAGTTRADLARAALEGVAFAVAAAADVLGLTPGAPVALTGGGGRSALVPQLLADVLGRPVRRIDVRSASATGAAVLAARGAGLELAVRRSAGAVVEPRDLPGLADAAQLWRAGLDGPAAVRVERGAAGHR